jgi:O-antigen/teichoic acid export membrane protein
VLACGVVADGGCSGVGGTDSRPPGQSDEPDAIDALIVAMDAGPLTPLAAHTRAEGVLGRTVWSFVGQALSSSSNFLLTVVVLSRGSRSEFATLSVVLTIYTFVLQLMRAGVGLPVTLLYSTDTGRSRVAEVRSAAGVALASSAAVALVLMVGGALSSRGGAQYLVLGAALPLLLLQDTARYACFAWGRPRTAAEADGLWVVLQVVTSAAVLVLADGSATTFLGLWAGAGAVSGCFLLRRTRLRPRFGTAPGWVQAHRGLWGRLVTDYLVSSGSHYAVYFALAVVAGSDELGRLKGAQTFLGPLIVLLLGGAVFGVPESVRAGGDPGRLWRLTLRLAGALIGAAVGCGAVVYLVLPVVGPATFPATWASARPAIPLLTVFASAIGASTGATSGLRALDQNSWLLRVRLATGPVLVLASIPASAAFGVNGALAVLSAVEWGVALAAWGRLRNLVCGLR